jgi:endonuclease/exonuclease/phosphatase family metal-dependent hydrolase
MKLKTLQWNIGGAKIRDINSDPTQGPGSLNPSYLNYDLEYIISKIKEFDVDIITLQETHVNQNVIQAKLIAERLGFQYWVNDKYSESHIEDDQDLCQSIISKYPISNHSFEFFKNPYFKSMQENGDEWVSFDKGCSFVQVSLPDFKNITVGTLHLVPFRRFKKEYNDTEVIEILNNVSSKIEPKIKDITLIQGDFNVNDKSLKLHLPNLFNYINEINTDDPTTPKGSWYDHVLYKGLHLINYKVDSSVLTDHYPIISEFEIYY